MKCNAIILSMLIALSLSGCVFPNAARYYHPKVDGGKVLKAYGVPTESIVEFALPGTNGCLHVRAFACNGKYVNQISLFFSGNAWNEIRFTSTDFQIHDMEKQLIIRPSRILAYTSDEITELTVDPYRTPPERTGTYRFHVQLDLPDRLPRRFELLCPTIVIDGEEMELPIIRFEQKLWIGISPFNA